MTIRRGPLDLERLHEHVKTAKLMMVDDELVNIKADEKHLRGIGYANIVTTTNSTEAFAMLCREKPDLLLLDIMMPHVTGIDLLQQIRNGAEWHNLPVIILTAYCDPTTKRQALEAGASELLAKPGAWHVDE